MFGKSRVAVAAVMVLGVAGMLAGPWASPASATLAPIRCFGECSTSSASTQGRVLSKHGNWSAVILGTRGMVVHEFDNGAKFAIVAHPNGEISLLLTHPDWRLQRDQRADILDRHRRPCLPRHVSRQPRRRVGCCREQDVRRGFLSRQPSSHRDRRIPPSHDRVGRRRGGDRRCDCRPEVRVAIGTRTRLPSPRMSKNGLSPVE